MGIDVIYNKLESAQSNRFGLIGLATTGGIPATSVGTAVCAAGGLPAALSNPVPCYRNEDQDAWMATFRVQRDFLP